ncbi:MAG: hypothetical protein ACREON_05780 [Gemmatimonadaceae bacterium]
MKTRLRLATAAMLLAPAACATAPNQESSAGGRSTITAEELQANASGNLYDAVRKLRPEWLDRQRAVSLMNDVEIVVYHDNTKVGGPDALRSIEISAVRVVRFMSASEAQGKFGVGHPQGAIQVVTRGR